MEHGEQPCPSCARPVPPGITYCPMCGVRLDGAPPTNSPARRDGSAPRVEGAQGGANPGAPDFVPLRYTPAPSRRRKRRPRDHEWQFWRPRHFSLRR